jgi:hypothetical protein
LPYSGVSDSAFEGMQPLSLLASSSLTGLNRFNPKACGLPPPGLRLTRLVAETRSRLGMEWAGSTLFQSHLQRPVVQHFVAHAYTLVTDLSIL